MTLAAGTRLGPYEIVSPLGAGGMGEVYRARDTNLARQVAIKVLPEAFAQDADRLARLEREARTLGSLNHPHIAIVHGLEKFEGTLALVMELVDGPTLADRIAQGPIPLDEALPIARQIAEALEAAHEQGIVHRDLKPANVKVRDDGTVKVLDFGLAKIVEAGGASRAGGGLDASQSPTITTPAMTMAGVILGTAAFMSPEQAKGRPADKRSDIWAFGCVFYEMLTGKRAFDGEDMTDVLGAVVRLDPDWQALPSDVPPLVRAGLEKCLVKDPRRRAGDISTVLFVLDKASSFPAPAAAVTSARGEMTRLSRRRIMLASSAAIVAVGVAIGGTWFAMEPGVPRVVRTTIATSGSASFTPNGNNLDLAVSPDGSRVIFRGLDGLVVRALDQLEPAVLRNLGGGGNVQGPFVSPDGQWIGFASGNTLRRVAITGGSPVDIARMNGGLRGATWGPDGTIVFATSTAGGLQRVPANGGEPVALTKPDGGERHLWPELLPGGGHVLFTILPATGPQLESVEIGVLDLRTGASKMLLRGGSHAQYVSTGHLLYNGGGTLRAVGFDLDRLEVRGASVPLFDQAAMTANLAVQGAVARDGTFVYLPVGAASATGQFGTPRSLVWVDRSGRETPVDLQPRTYTYPRLSPDGTRAVLDIRDEQNDLWLWDVSRPTLTRLTFDPGTDYYPVWTPDGQRVAFYSAGQGGNIFWLRVDGPGAAERLTASQTVPHYPYAISRDGRRLVFQESTKTGVDLSVLSLPARTAPPAQAAADPGEPSQSDVKPLIHTEFIDTNAEVSPDGRWVAYQSNRSGGRDEIFVQPFPNVESGLRQVSTAGGTRPLWSRDGRELFYLDANNLLTVARVQTAPTFSVINTVTLFKTAYFSGFGGGGQTVAGRTYDVSPDGRRFLMIKDVNRDQAQANLVVVQNWFEELKRLVPTR